MSERLDRGIDRLDAALEFGIHHAHQGAQIAWRDVELVAVRQLDGNQKAFEAGAGAMHVLQRGDFVGGIEGERGHATALIFQCVCDGL